MLSQENKFNLLSFFFEPYSPQLGLLNTRIFQEVDKNKFYLTAIKLKNGISDTQPERT